MRREDKHKIYECSFIVDEDVKGDVFKYMRFKYSQNV